MFLGLTHGGYLLLPLSKKIKVVNKNVFKTFSINVKHQ